jgi:uncharacterized repeat protein (TIGR01451 family)
MKKLTYLFCSALMIALLFLTLHFAVQTSGAAAGNTIVEGIESSTEQVGPDWYNAAWHYRKPVIVSNSGSQLNNYQVLVKLDSSNFDFNKTKSDGSDVRFTAPDGITLIDYWIESWDKTSQLAYIWVEVPLLANGNTSTYLYYSNQGASNNSNGSATFNFFEDLWTQFTISGGGCGGTPWYCLNPGATVSSGKLVLNSGAGVSTRTLYQHKAVGFRANYGLGNGLELGGFSNGAYGKRAVIRDLTSDVNDLYLQDYGDEVLDNNIIERVGNIDWHDYFHVYEVRWWIDDQQWVNNKSVGDIDHGLSSAPSMIPSEVPTDTLSVTFNSAEGSTATLLVDWVYVREYRDPEPTVATGVEQGAVDLRVSQIDSPDPLHAGEEITYLLTISNTSGIDAMGVILTDTLPVGASFVSATPTQGSCITTVCNMGTITAHDDASITVKADTTIDGILTNRAVVNSFSYDLNTNNNYSQETTTVLLSADLVIDLQGVPDALMPENILTYIITVTNQGPSFAGMVNVVNNLPQDVVYLSSSPITCSKNGSVVTCPIPTPMAPGTKTEIRISVIVKIGAMTQNMSSSATVSSGNTFDPNLTNNNSTEITLLDATLPDVRWISPVQNEATYFTYGGRITLEARAEDIVFGVDQIGQVEFKLWDHLLKPADWGWSGVSTSSPYQVEFTSDVLVPGEIYQMYVYATDRAGNQSRQRILIDREYSIFLPLNIK